MKKIKTIIKTNKFLIGLLILGGILRFYHIDFQSAWLDELHSLNETNPNLSFSEVYDAVYKGEQMPVLYFYLIYFLFKIFGYSVLVLRMFSVVLGVISIFTTYILGKELFNKATGLISALLIVVNIFHITYSQEGRPYIFLYLFTTMSFFYLIKFIKKPHFKRAILYGIFTGLMLYGHFFAIFSILAQYLFLFFIMFFTPEERKKLFLGGITSGFIVLIMHIPSIKIILNISNISSFWVQKPTLDIYTTIFKTFFGNSEMLLFLITLIGIFYFIINFSDPIKNSQDDSEKTNLINNPLQFSFLLFTFWAVITMILPLIRSYLKVPMIVDRYFITLLPLIILVLAIGIYKIRSSYIRISFLFLIVLFALTDIIVVKKYYTRVSKSDFRAVSEVVMSNKVPDEKIYSNLSWYYSFYLKETNLIQNSLDEVIFSMISDPTKITSFWYLDGHVNVFNATEQTKLFLDKHFYLEDDVSLYGAWAKHYILKSQNVQVDVSKLGSLTENKGDKIIFGIDDFSYSNSALTMKGWAILENFDANNSKIIIVLISSDSKITKIPHQQVSRNDVTLAFNGTSNYDNSGFYVQFEDKDIPHGKYEVGIIIKNLKLNKEGFVLINQQVLKIN